MRDWLSRVALVAAALGVAVWLASGLGPARDQARALALLESQPGADDPALPRARRLLRDAAAATRSTAPELRLAQVELFNGNDEDAAGLAASIVRREPENADAWLLLAQASREGDPARAAAARARYGILSPPAPPPP